MQRQPDNMRYTEWRLDDEMAYIDESVNGLPGKERVLWLERYRDACLRRNDWGAMSGQKVINYIEQVLLYSKLMVMDLKPGVRK